MHGGLSLLEAGNQRLPVHFPRETLFARNSAGQGRPSIQAGRRVQFDMPAKTRPRG
jgi:hypothetical protein